MKLTIQVTQDDIDNGVPGDECNCPIARAIKRTNPDIDPDSVSVSESRVDLAEFTGPLPVVASFFIQQFDAYGAEAFEISPFTFNLEVY